jgi:hypothetical protein
VSGSWQSTLENKAVDAYLHYLATGELPPPPNVDAKVEVLDTKIANEPRMYRKVQLLQERRDLTQPTVGEADLIEAFVKHAPGFSERNGIAYVTWREMGVPAGVLKQAGLKAASDGGNKLAPDDPRRIRPYANRRPWTDEEKARYVATYDAHGVDVAMEEAGLSGTEHAAKQRYWSFRRQLGLPTPSNRGRPRKGASKKAS